MYRNTWENANTPVNAKRNTVKRRDSSKRRDVARNAASNLLEGEHPSAAMTVIAIVKVQSPVAVLAPKNNKENIKNEIII